jgi:alcohol dehydrogenase class IV
MSMRAGEAKADGIINCGSDSVTDAGNMVQLCLRHRQDSVSDAMNRPDEDAVDANRNFVSNFGLPIRRRDVGANAEQFVDIASKPSRGRYIHTDPSAFGLDDVLTILEHIS